MGRAGWGWISRGRKHAQTRHHRPRNFPLGRLRPDRLYLATSRGPGFRIRGIPDCGSDARLHLPGRCPSGYRGHCPDARRRAPWRIGRWRIRDAAIGTGLPRPGGKARLAGVDPEVLESDRIFRHRGANGLFARLGRLREPAKPAPGPDAAGPLRRSHRSGPIPRGAAGPGRAARRSSRH